jgi:hypothetical protein
MMPHPIGEPLELEFAVRDEWAGQLHAWEVRVTPVGRPEVLDVDADVQTGSDGIVGLLIATDRLPIQPLVVWIRTPSDEILVVPVDLYAY